MRIGNDLSASQHIPAFLPQRKVSHFSITEENTGAATKLDDTMKLIEASKEPQKPNSLSDDMRLKINGLGAAQSIDDGITGVADTNALNAVDSSLYQLKSLAAYGTRDDICDADRALCLQEFSCLINGSRRPPQPDLHCYHLGLPRPGRPAGIAQADQE